MTIEGPKILFMLFGFIPISETTVNSWLIIIGVLALCLFFTSKLKIVPTTKRQVIAEILVNALHNMVTGTMGTKCLSFVPYVATIFTFSLFGSLISLITLRPVTGDVNVILTWALISFVLVQYNAIRTKKLGGYLKAFTEPVALITPINIISEFSSIISLTFRHFGNIIAGLVITKLIYYALENLSHIFTAIPIFQVGLPAVLSLYFDLFTGFLQAFIFCTLSMVYISGAMDESACN